MSVHLADLTSPGERQLAMAHRHWAAATRSFVEFPHGAIERSIPERFERIVDLYSDRPAIRAGDQTLTYEALNRLANRLAHVLVAKLGTQNVPVAFLLEPGALPIVASLGVLKAGMIYIALDRTHPSERLAKVLQDSQARAIVTNGQNLARTQELCEVLAGARGQVDVIRIDELESNLSEENLGLVISPDQFAGIFYSSGTMGQMKGVTHSHRTLLHRTMAVTNSFRICCDDREPQLFSPSVARSLKFVDILLNGGTILPYDPKSTGAAHLVEWLIDRRVTILSLTPGLLRQLVGALPQADVKRFAHVRLLTIAGEPMTRQDIVLWQEHFAPNCVLVNLMASTEAGRVAQFFLDKESPIPGGPIPVGYPSLDKEIELVDEDGRPVEPDQVGEIVVKSRYLTPGYWGKPALTGAVFRPDSEGTDRRLCFSGDLGRLRPDGALEFVGRKDFQVKIRGHTVQLNEVEMALLDTNNIEEAVVVSRPRQEGEQRLVAYLVANTRPVPTVHDMRVALRDRLADHMIPSIFVFLDALPRLVSGKVDRSALPVPEQRRPETGALFVAPRTGLEIQLANIWVRVLELDRVGIDDNFFELGGDSLSAMLMILEVEKFINKSVPIDYFHNPTIAALAEMMYTPGPSTGNRSTLSAATAAQKSKGNSSPQSWESHAGQASVKRVLRWSVPRILLRLSYEQGIHWLHTIGQPAIANRLYQEERAYFRCVAGSLGNPSAASADAFRTSVLSNIIWGCREQLRRTAPLPPGGLIDAMHTSRHRFWRDFANRVDRAVGLGRRPLIQFTGLEYLVHAYKLNRGIILLSFHCPAASMAIPVLSRQTTLGVIPTLSNQVAHQMADWDEPYVGESFEEREAGWSAKFAVQGQRILAQGGVVQIINDVSYEDANSIRKSIGGRHYDLKPGFAELAFITGAAVLPVYSVYDQAGILHLNLLPALEPVHGTASREEYVDCMLDQYVAFLEDTWRKTPASLGWGSMRRFTTRPLSGLAPNVHPTDGNVK